MSAVFRGRLKSDQGAGTCKDGGAATEVGLVGASLMGGGLVGGGLVGGGLVGGGG